MIVTARAPAGDSNEFADFLHEIIAGNNSRPCGGQQLFIKNDSFREEVTARAPAGDSNASSESSLDISIK